MFIISNKNQPEHAIASYIKSLKFDDRPKPTIHEVPLFFSYSLFWVSLKPSDNIHIFINGIIIGKLDLNEENSLNPFYHQVPIPKVKNPLIFGVSIIIENEKIEIKPNEQCPIYYSNNSVSDFQLLIAKVENLKPYDLGVATLSSVGYFPGKITLFNEIKTVPYLNKLSLPKLDCVNHKSFKPKRPNDDYLINELISILPRANNSLALSGGLDSRFLLGVLNKAGFAPKIYTLSTIENNLVENICKSMKLDLDIKNDKPVDEFKYTLMSDARIYFRGGNYSRMCNYDSFDEILHVGIWSDPTIENAFKSSWKFPSSVRSVYRKFIWYNLLQKLKDKQIHGLKTSLNKKDIYEFLYMELQFQKSYYLFNNRVQWARWFYHINRGINWSNAFLSDASFFIYPVFILGNMKAVELGINSPAYSNFAKERLRCLNRMLLPNIRIDYSDGRKFESYPFLINDIYKIYYEYVKSLVRWGINTKLTSKTSKIDWFSDVNSSVSHDFSSFYSKSLDNLLEDKNVQIVTKRAAVTINNVLKFLNQEDIGLNECNMKTHRDVHFKKSTN